MANDTATDPSYWLNWRFFTCAVSVLLATVGASIVIWKYEGSGSSSLKSACMNGENQLRPGYLHRDDVWKTSVPGIHPGWLLAYRSCALAALFVILISNLRLHGAQGLFFYTQWTFILVTLYFGVGSALSVNGCCVYCAELISKRLNAERSTYEAPPQNAGANILNTENCADVPNASSCKPTAGFLGYSFQVFFQVAAGSAMLSDFVFWFLVYPFHLRNSSRLDFLVFSMHFFNVVFLIGDAFLNSLRFPFFRLAYFALWTNIYVIFQWGVHACFSTWWPYPFMDLSSPCAPAWYLAIGLIQLPCFGFFALTVKLKDFLLSRFPSLSDVSGPKKVL